MNTRPVSQINGVGSQVVWATRASTEAMGLQGYERCVQEAMRRRLLGGDRVFHEVRVTSIRNRVPAARRMPSRLHETCSLPTALLLGALIYRTRHLVHRFDLRLPPSPSGEVVTVHDLPSLHFQDEAPVPRSAAASLRRAKRIIVPSQFTKDELCAVFELDPDHVTVIANGLDPIFLDRDPLHHDSPPLVNGPFVLHAAGATWRKNLQALAGAWRQLASENDRLQLVLCGPSDSRRSGLFAQLPRTVLAGRLPPARIASLMSRAELVVVPSLYEGFGLPALEAMAVGTPVVAAARAALPEVCGDAAVLVEPTVAGLLDGMRAVLRDADLGRRLGALGKRRASTFTWDRSARDHLEVYDEVLSPS